MLNILANIGVVVVAILHLCFFILEFFFWSKPIGLKLFRMNHDQANDTASLAANQGIYNLFLSAGLLYGLLAENLTEALHVTIFFLCCVIVAGAYGGFSVNRKIVYIQALPAVLTLVLVTWSNV